MFPLNGWLPSKSAAKVQKNYGKARNRIIKRRTELFYSSFFVLFLFFFNRRSAGRFLPNAHQLPLTPCPLPPRILQDYGKNPVGLLPQPYRILCTTLQAFSTQAREMSISACGVSLFRLRNCQSHRAKFFFSACGVISNSLLGSDFQPSDLFEFQPASAEVVALPVGPDDDLSVVQANFPAAGPRSHLPERERVAAVVVEGSVVGE